ncbi:MAG: carbon-nitrogen hydrolase family protein [Treponema sp.]|nr:carbon-nitrogen hydrolase family protein [Treponema sp.]
MQTHVSDDKEDNLSTAEKYVKSAAGQGADIAVLPEMFCCPYANESFVKNAEAVSGKIWSFLSETAKRYNLYLVGGSIPELEDGRIYNTSFVFDRSGKQIARHRKMHLFNVDIEGGQKFRESDTFSAGGGITLFDTEFGRFGLCICFDMRFPELTRLMALDGAKMIIAPAAFNMTTGPMHWETMFRQRAVDDQVFTVGVSPARDESGVYVSYANSILCSPWGKVLARAEADPELITAEIDFNEVERARQQLPLLAARREDVYALTPLATPLPGR